MLLFVEIKKILSWTIFGKILHRIYTFVLVPCLTTCTNIRMPLSLCEWTVFTCVQTFTCSSTLRRMNHSQHSSPLTRVRKPLWDRAPRMARRMTQQMTRRICDWYTGRSPRYSRKCVNAVLEELVENITGNCLDNFRKFSRTFYNLFRKL